LIGGAATRVTGSGPTDLWAAAGGALLHGDGSSWVVALGPQDVGGTVFDVWASAPDDVWALGGDTFIHHWDGTGWTTEDPAPRPATHPEMRAISGTGPDDVWVLRGTNSVLHWDGQTWISRQPQIDNLVGVWAAGPNEAWVVGDGVAHWLNGLWSSPRLPIFLASASFTAVSGTGPADVWILAGDYVVKVSDDQQDLLEGLLTDTRPMAVAPAGPAGSGVWVLVPEGAADSRLFQLSGTPPTHNISAGLVAPAGLDDLWSAPDGTLWAAGAGGALIRKRPAP
jgi:hypothetical protein